MELLIHKILTLTQQFRSAIEKTDFSDSKTTLGANSFPKGCCDDASLLLATFLNRYGIRTTRIKGVSNSEDYSDHVWLKAGKIHIDITADQYEDNQNIIVESDSKFHQSFEIDEEDNLSDFNERFSTDERWLSYFMHDYENILNNLIKTQ